MSSIRLRTRPAAVALQGHDREAPETHPVLPAYERVAKKPTTRARRLNQQIKPVAVAMGASRGGAAFNIGQPYRGPHGPH